MTNPEINPNDESRKRSCYPVEGHPHGHGVPIRASTFGLDSSFVIRHSSFRLHGAFTLVELLVVISIIGLLAAVAVPVVRKFSPNVTAGATRQLLDAVSRARQLAISQRTTVYMVFVPPATNGWFWLDPRYGVNWGSNDLASATNLFDKQMVAYTFVELHALGDQPGSPTPHYLAPWRTLPEGTYIPMEKFRQRQYPNQPALTIYTNVPGTTSQQLAFQVYGFYSTNGIPFPVETTPSAVPAQQVYVYLPFIAFNYLGQLVDASGTPTGVNEIIPLAQGAVNFARDPATGAGIRNPPSVNESPAGNTTNSFNLVSIDWLTGRAHVEHPQVQ
jgi:prepilin-type N-terminal cleavage/methylation domain-containing protein